MIGGSAITKGPFGTPFAFITSIGVNCTANCLLNSCIFSAAGSQYFIFSEFGQAFLVYRFILLYYDYMVFCKNSLLFSFNLFQDCCSLESPNHETGLDELTYYTDLGYF